MNLSYATIRPIDVPIPAERQAAKRHYGVHPYFTRRPFNVVREYILHYSKPRDTVLDPFGGSGVTAIEAFLENRVGVHNDINPLANFIASGIADLSKGNIEDYQHALYYVEDRCAKTLHQLEQIGEVELAAINKSLILPPNCALPSNSDVEHYHDLFTPRQLTALALLKQAVDEIPQRYPKQAMLLAWSAALTKLNKTFLSAEGRAESRGGSSIFSIYRYKLAKNPVELPSWQTFKERAQNVIAAKREVDKTIEVKKRTEGWFGSFRVMSKDIQALSEQFEQQIDYIFTDPPYGGHISYLDLSTLWNSWLGCNPTDEDRSHELIVGGELGLSETNYVDRLRGSIKACMHMLKPRRWLSVVFQHWNAAYFEAILTSAESGGGELKAAISQVGDPIWSMHKKKRNESVLAGELILTFFKSGARPRVRQKNQFNVHDALYNILAASPSQIYGESLFNQLVIEAWKASAIESLNISKTEFIQLLKDHGWQYHERNHYWSRGANTNRRLFAVGP